MKVLAIMLMLMLGTAQADPAAQVVVLRGEVTANDAALVQGSLINVGDKLVAGEKSFAVLQFSDGSSVTIRPDSVLFLEEYSYLEGDSKARLDLVQGGLRILTGAIAKKDPDAYTVSTPVALMGVRGTEFSIYLLPDGCTQVDPGCSALME